MELTPEQCRRLKRKVTVNRKFEKLKNQNQLILNDIHHLHVMSQSTNPSLELLEAKLNSLKILVKDYSKDCEDCISLLWPGKYENEATKLATLKADREFQVVWMKKLSRCINVQHTSKKHKFSNIWSIE